MRRLKWILVGLLRYPNLCRLRDHAYFLDLQLARFPDFAGLKNSTESQFHPRVRACFAEMWHRLLTLGGAGAMGRWGDRVMVESEHQKLTIWGDCGAPKPLLVQRLPQ